MTLNRALPPPVRYQTLPNWYSAIFRIDRRLCVCGSKGNRTLPQTLQGSIATLEHLPPFVILILSRLGNLVKLRWVTGNRTQFNSVSESCDNQSTITHCFPVRDTSTLFLRVSSMFRTGVGIVGLEPTKMSCSQSRRPSHWPISR